MTKKGKSVEVLLGGSDPYFSDILPIKSKWVLVQPECGPVGSAGFLLRRNPEKERRVSEHAPRNGKVV